MTAKSDYGKLLIGPKNLDKALKKLNDSNFISIFFLLMGIKSPTNNQEYIPAKKYLEIIKLNKNEKESFLKNCFLQIKSKDLLIEILGTIKRYDLLKIFNVCRHEIQHHSSSLNVIWKSLYEVFECFDYEKDTKYLKKVFPEVSISDEDILEIVLVEAYNDNLISDEGLSVLLTNLNKDHQKSRTWALHNDHYFIRTPTATSPCGLAIIINHENFSFEENNGLKRREYSHLDVEALDKLWKSFGFETQIYQDFNKEDVLNLFEKLSETDLSSYDVFVTCYMSHGKEGVVYSSDCKSIPITCLIDFMANKCKSLLNKPKLFFIEACQGKNIQCDIELLPPIFSTPPNTYSNFAKYPSGTPLYADVLVATSSIPGFVSFVSNNKNSWFIEALTENMESYGHTHNIFEVLVKVNKQVSKKEGTLHIQGQCIYKCKQTVEEKNTFRKILQLKKLNTL